MAYGLGDDRHSSGVDLVPQEVASDLAVVPGIGRLDPPLPGKVARFPIVIRHTVLVPLDLALFIPCRGPIPEGLGGTILGVNGVVAGHAGQVLGVAIEMMVQELLAPVRLRGMTVRAGPAPLGHRQSKAATGDLVVSGLVTILTLEAEASHVNVRAGGVEIEKGIELTVLDRILAAT